MRGLHGIPRVSWTAKRSGYLDKVFTARCTIVQCAVLRSHVVRPSVCLSICLSVTLVDQDHIGRKSWKLIARTIISLTPSLFVAQTPSTYSQGNMRKFCGDQRWGGKEWCAVLEHKSGHISETRTDRGKVTWGIGTHQRSFKPHHPRPPTASPSPRLGFAPHPKLQSLLSQDG